MRHYNVKVEKPSQLGFWSRLVLQLIVVAAWSTVIIELARG